jgi:hypothetical protein
MMHLLALLSADTSISVGDVDVELLSTLDDGLSLVRRDAGADLSGILAVVHQQHVDIAYGEDSELVEARWQSELGLVVAAIADLGHGAHASELSAHTVVNTLRLAPAGL